MIMIRLKYSLAVELEYLIYAAKRQAEISIASSAPDQTWRRVAFRREDWSSFVKALKMRK
jgi:hypothetical protein